MRDRKDSRSRISRREVLSTAVRAVAGGIVVAAGRNLVVPARALAAPQVMKSIDTLKVGISSDPGNLNPWLANGTFQWATFWPTIYESVLWRDDKMNLVGSLAERWDVKGSDITLYLRQGVTFHNGHPLDAEAVQYTIQQISAPASRSVWQSFLAPIQGITIADSHTMTLHMDRPLRAVVSNLTICPVVDPAFVKATGDKWAVQPVGTGPYKFVEYVPGDHMTVEANPAYWGPKAKIPRIEFRWIPEPGTRLAALQAGEVQMINSVPPDQAAAVSGNPKLKVVSGATARTICFVFRCDRAPFTDKRVRQALNYAVDKNAIIKNILGGLAGQAATGPLHPSVLGASVTLPPFTYNPQKARALLREAGATGATILMGAPNGRYNADTQVAEAVQGYLQAVGVNVKLQIEEWPTYIGNIQKGPETKVDMYLLGFSPATFDSDYYRSQWVPPQSTIWNGYNNQDVNKRMDEASLITDRRLAELAYHPVMADLWDDPPFLYLYFEKEVDGADRRLTGFTPLPDQFFRFASFDLPA